MSGLPGFFDFDDRLKRLSDLGDQLEAFGKAVDFEMFRYDLSTALGYTSGKRNALENVLITDTLDEHHSRLSDVGFKRHLTWFQFLNFVSVVAFK